MAVHVCPRERAGLEGKFHFTFSAFQAFPGMVSKEMLSLALNLLCISGPRGSYRHARGPKGGQEVQIAFQV